ncbi:hypothetical protein AWC11_12070 [Mycobacterium interjectum]|nr:hypothetical protein AWC11_12070 [Mycobacterium interjectum]
MTDDHNSLTWFHRLSMDDKVHLLRDPYGALPPRLVDQFLSRPGVVGTYWMSQISSTRWTLVPAEAARIADQRDQLEWWWSHIDDADQAYLVEHRSEELPKEYASVVTSAGSTGSNPALVVVMVADNRTGRFRLPLMVDVFVELKARDRGL